MADDNNTITANTSNGDNGQGGSQATQQTEPKKVSIAKIEEKLTPEEKEAFRMKYVALTHKELEKKGMLLKENQVPLDKETAKQYQEAYDKILEIEKENLIKAGNFEKIKEQELNSIKLQYEKKLKEIAEQSNIKESKIQELESNFTKERQERLNSIIKNTIMTMLRESGAEEPIDAYKLIKDQVKLRDDDPNGDIIIVDDKGEVYYNKDTQKPLSIADFITGFASAKPYLFKKNRPFSPAIGSNGSSSLMPLSPENIQNAGDDQFKAALERVGLGKLNKI